MRRIVSTYFLALGFVVAVSAQEPAARPQDASPSPAPAAGPSAPQNPDSPALSSPADQETPRPTGTAGQTPAGADKPIMVTGCISGGPAAFTLTNAMAAGAAAGDKPGDKPAAGAVGTAGISSSYDLTARAGVDLSSHVGHKVEITGTPAPAAASPGAATSPGAPGSKPAAPKLTVTAVKMMSTTCP